MGLGLLTEFNEQSNNTVAKKQSKTNPPVKNKGNRKVHFSLIKTIISVSAGVVK